MLTIRNRWPLIATAAAVQLLGSAIALGWLAHRAESEARRILSRQALSDNRRLAISLVQALGSAASTAKPTTSAAAEGPDWRAAVQRLIDQTSVPNRGVLTAVHADSGELLCHPRLRRDPVLKGSRPGLAILHPLEGEGGSAQLIIDAEDASGTAEIEGATQLVAVVDVPKLRIKILAQQPQESVVATAGSIWWAILGAGLTLVAISTGLAGLAIVIVIGRQEKRLGAIMSDLDRQVEERTRDLERNVRLLRVELFFQKREENKKLGANEKLSASIQNVTDYSIITVDPTGRIITCNTGAKKVSGYLGREMLGQSFSKLFAVRDRSQKRFKSLLLEAERAGCCEIQGWRERKDGSRYWTKSVIHAIRDTEGQLTTFIEIARDVTAAKKRAESLRLLRQSMARSPEGVLIIDSRRRGLPVVWANRAFQRLSRRGPQDVLDQPLAQALGWGQEIGDELRKALKDGLPESVESRIVRKNGASFRGTVSVAPIRDASGRTSRWTVIISSLEPSRGEEGLAMRRLA